MAITQAHESAGEHVEQSRTDSRTYRGRKRRTDMTNNNIYRKIYPRKDCGKVGKRDHSDIVFLITESVKNSTHTNLQLEKSMAFNMAKSLVSNSNNSSLMRVVIRIRNRLYIFRKKIITP